MTVSQVNEQAKILLESHFDEIAVDAEISKITKHSSGHWYLTLKDEKSSLSAIMYRYANQNVKFNPENGMKVSLTGKLTIYSQSGSYQMIISKISPIGIGDLELAFKQLKEKLKLEGLFDSEHKKPLPKYPKRVAIVTSTQSAAYEDMKKIILQSKYFNCEFIAFNTLVQGTKAAQNLIEVLQKADKMKFDLIVMARGGGSKEDLWCFNDENLSRVIFSLQTPIISAIGHEIDFSISDFVADHRSPTPTAAIYDLLPDTLSIMQKLDSTQDFFNNLITNKISSSQNLLTNIKSVLQDKTILHKIDNAILNLENKKLRFDKIIGLKMYNLTYKINQIEIILQQKEYFFNATKQLVQIKKDGKNIELSKLKSGDEIYIYSQNASKIAVVK